MTANPRSSKHCKLCRFEIKSVQLGSQIYVPINRYSLSVDKVAKARARNVRRTWSQCMPGRVLTPRARENMAVSQWYVYPRDMCIPAHISLVICVSPPKWRPVICVSPTPLPSTLNDNNISSNIQLNILLESALVIRSLTGRTKNPNRLNHKSRLLKLKKLSMRY